MGLFEAGIRAQATDHVALLAEAWLPLLWTGPDNLPSRPALFPWGARFHSQRLALDIGIISGQVGYALPWSLPIGAPYLSVGGAIGRESQ